MNCVILRGVLTRDVELRTTKNGTNIARFGLAIRRDVKNSEGKYDSDFVNCVAYGNIAEVIEKYHHKGSSIIIEGRIQSGSYEKDGVKINTTDIVVNKIHFDRNNNEKKEEVKEETKTEYYVPRVEEDPYEKFGERIEMEGNDLPF